MKKVKITDGWYLSRDRYNVMLIREYRELAKTGKNEGKMIEKEESSYHANVIDALHQFIDIYPLLTDAEDLFGVVNRVEEAAVLIRQAKEEIELNFNRPAKTARP